MTLRLAAGWFLLTTCFGGKVSVYAAETVVVRGQVLDAADGKLLPARVTIRSADGQWFFPKSAAPQGSAIEYRRQHGEASIEMHTTLSADPFIVELPPGKYAVSAERGKEYFGDQREIVVGRDPVEVELKLRRWIDMTARGWYSGDTHVHRDLAEVPNAMLAEDLNVALPLSHWVTAADTSPAAGNRVVAPVPSPQSIQVDATHVIYPVNSEYEIFTVGGKQHTLGAVLLLGHKTPLEAGVPPVRPIAERARREGALVDLEKHSWPWSVSIVPLVKVDLFELANNHVWQTEFGLPDWTLDTAPQYMHLEMTPRGFTEWGWIDFGFQTYYALLNCGFHLRPTAGTAAGVHPVPLGFGRVYVHLSGDLSFERWFKALDAGDSFVTTGPMLLIEVNGHRPGSTFAGGADRTACRVTGSAESAVPLDRVEIIVNGQIAKTLTPENEKTAAGGYLSRLDETLDVDGSGWIVVRAFERRPDKRVRFAHSSPIYVDVPGKPLRPRREEAQYLVQRAQEEVDRNQSVLPPAAMDEYREALKVYQEIAKTAR